MADEKRMKEVFSDEAFVKSLMALETPEEVKAELKKKGVDLTVDEILSIREALVKKTTGKEVTEEDLEKVAGGVLSSSLIPSLIAMNPSIGMPVYSVEGPARW